MRERVWTRHSRNETTLAKTPLAEQAAIVGEEAMGELSQISSRRAKNALARRPVLEVPKSEI